MLMKSYIIPSRLQTRKLVHNYMSNTIASLVCFGRSLVGFVCLSQ